MSPFLPPRQLTVSSTTGEPPWGFVGVFAAALLAAGTLALVQGDVRTDYYLTFRPVTEEFLAYFGSPYIDNNAFNNAPWTLLLLIPFSGLTPKEGQVIMDLTSLACIASSVLIFQRFTHAPRLFELLCVLNLHTLNLLVSGQIDAFILIGLALGYWAFQHRHPFTLSLALWLILMKPQNVILPTAFLLYSCKGWTRLDWMQIVSMPALSVLGAGLAIGFDWPIRYIAHLLAYPPPTFPLSTLWRAINEVGITPIPFVGLMIIALVLLMILAIRNLSDDRLLPLSLTSNIAFTPYVLGYSYVLLIPGFLSVSRRIWPLAVLAYGLTWTPLLRYFSGWSMVWLDVGYPLLLFLAILLASTFKPNSTNSHP